MKLLLSGYGAGPTLALYEFDGKTARCLWTDSPPAPSFLCRAKTLLLAGLERDEGGEIRLYRPKGDGYALVESAGITGGGLCHLAYSEPQKMLYASCYATGHIAAIRLENDHFAGEPTELCDLQGGASRTHCCTLSPDGRFLYTVNIAQDRIYCYLAERGTLTENPQFSFLSLPPGEGPRQLHFHPQRPLAYLITEYTSRIFVLDWNSESGVLQIHSSCSALPSGFSEESYGSALAISPDGKRLYAGNRGADSIGCFSIQAGSELQKLQDAPCGGNWPRHIALSQDESFLLCANQHSNEVVLLPIFRPSGRLGEPAIRIPFSAPCFVIDVSVNSPAETDYPPP